MKLSKHLIIAFIGLFSLSQVTSARSYLDVPIGHKNHTAINALSTRGIVNGYSNGEFHPDGLINRAEAVKILTKPKYPATVIDSSLDWHRKLNHSYAIFPDVPLPEWYSKYVEVAYQNNIIKGYSDNSFKPGNNINFAEALKVILESYKVDFSQNNYRPNKLLYVKQGEWFEKYFTYAYEQNLINREKFYHPGQFITRGEFVEIQYRLEEMLKTRSSEYVRYQNPISNEYTVTIPALNIINVDITPASIYDPEQALSVLNNGMGHYLNTPDTERKTVLYGHSSSYSWDTSSYTRILREINKLKNGDSIYINYQEKGYVYEIYDSVIIPESQDYTLVQNETNHELTMFTCWPPDSIAQRYVIHAKPI